MLSRTFFLPPSSTPTPQVLLIQGFLACRKHSERIVLMVKMMSKSGLPCFKSGAERTVRALEKRLALNLTEVQVRPVSKGRRHVAGGPGFVVHTEARCGIKVLWAALNAKNQWFVCPVPCLALTCRLCRWCCRSSLTA